MGKPSYSDLELWVGQLISKEYWNKNFKKIVDWLSDGSADLVVSTIKPTNGIDMDGSKITNVGAATAGTDAVNLDTAQSLLNQTSYYGLFTVASGKEDTDGNSAFLQKDSDTQVTVLAGSTNPDITLCQSDGTVETITSNVTLTVGTSDDTYYIIKEKGSTVTITSANFSTGKVLPTSSITAGDYFLDNSTIPFKGYKYDSTNGWVLTPFCYMGKVVVSSGSATVTAVSYDNNGYNWNKYNFNLPDYGAGVSISSSSYTAPADGWLYIQVGTSNDYTIAFYIDGHMVGYDAHNGGEHAHTSSTMVPISKNSILTRSQWGSTGQVFNLDIRFYPMKGV